MSMYMSVCHVRRNDNVKVPSAVAQSPRRKEETVYGMDKNRASRVTGGGDRDRAATLMYGHVRIFATATIAKLTQYIIIIHDNYNLISSNTI